MYNQDAELIDAVDTCKGYTCKGYTCKGAWGQATETLFSDAARRVVISFCCVLHFIVPFGVFGPPYLGTATAAPKSSAS